VDSLTEARQVARERAIESFEYFANYVLGARLDPDLCDVIQQDGMCDRGEKYERAYDAWLAVQRLGPKLALAPTETFRWLFSDFVEGVA
jgi:hypothetical protein